MLSFNRELVPVKPEKQAFLARLDLIRKQFKSDPRVEERLHVAINTPGFADLSANKQIIYFQVLMHTDISTARILAADIANHKNGQSKMMQQGDCGFSTLDYLHFMATAKLPKQIKNQGLSRSLLIQSLIKECLQPGGINQGLHKTCAAACVQYLLCLAKPQEYARIVTNLVLNGDCKLISGQKLSINTSGLKRDPYFPLRSDSARIFQSTIMDLGNGAEVDYCNVRDAHFLRTKKKSQIGENKHGLNASQLKLALDAVFGCPYKIFDFENKKDKQKYFIDLLKKSTNKDIILGMYWRNQEASLHAVNYLGYKDGRFYFKNSWASTQQQKNTELKNPRRRVENAAQGVESMTAEDFVDTLKLFLCPAK